MTVERNLTEGMRPRYPGITVFSLVSYCHNCLYISGLLRGAMQRTVLLFSSQLRRSRQGDRKRWHSRPNCPKPRFEAANISNTVSGLIINFSQCYYINHLDL